MMSISILIIGITAGIISGIVKLGWEVILPPRTDERNETNPPQKMLQQMGVPYRITHLTYSYSGLQIPWVSLIMHFAFSIFFSVLYCWIFIYFPIISIGMGTIFGLIIWIVYHIILMPMLKTVPPFWKQPWEEHFSEALGHMVWGFTIHLVLLAFI